MKKGCQTKLENTGNENAANLITSIGIVDQVKSSIEDKKLFINIGSPKSISSGFAVD
jgi:hypothetical protein